MTVSDREADRAGAFASALRSARVVSGLTRAELAAAADVDRSVLSRLENGRYPHRVSTHTLARLTEALGCGDALYTASTTATPAAAALLADPFTGQVAGDGAALRSALGRTHRRHLARRVEDASLADDGRRVDEGRLWHACCAATVRGKARPDLVGPDGGGQWSGRRFQVAHAAAHLLLGTDCSWPRVADQEQDTNDLAAVLLAPETQLDQAVYAAFARGVTPWDSDTGGLVAAVGDALVVPGWVAASRLADTKMIHFYLEPDRQETPRDK